MTRKTAWMFLIPAAWMLVAIPSAVAQQESAGSAAGEEMGIDVKADQLEYEADQKLMIGQGNVVIRYKGDVLRCDYVSVQTETQDAHAKGNVLFEREGKTWKGEELRYNFRTQQGEFGNFDAFVDPFYVTAEESERRSEDEFVLHRATITTCAGPNPQFRIRARQARIVQGKKLRARGVIFYLGAVPFFYLPYIQRALGDEWMDIDLVPGYSSRMGPYLLTAFNYRLTDGMRAATHLDYRLERGLGVGQDLLWGDPRITYNGTLKGYYVDDAKPFNRRSDEDKAEYADQVDSERYRLRLSDVRTFSDRDTAYTELQYVSDPLFREDFFDSEYRDNVVPENRIALVHREDWFTASLELNRRLNDFYENVNRLPQATFTVPRLQLGDSPIYYESENSAAWLERVYRETSDNESYDAFRVDSGHTLYYPTKNFGFLVFTPRAGYRATYYSKTYQTDTTTNLVTSVDSNGVVTATNDISSTITETGADLRNVYEVGFETSFKAFKLIHNDWIGRDDQGLRHVVEPYAVHTYIPEPNVVPENLPQFDEIDDIDKRHDVKVGVRNKFQTKRRKQVHSLVDANVWTTYRIEKEEDQNEITDVNFRVQLRMAEWLPVDFEGAYDTYEGELTQFNGQAAFIATDDTRLSLDYLYRKDVRDQLAAELSLFPNQRWSFNTYARYALDRSQVEEVAAFVTHKNDCLGVGVGYRQLFKEDDEEDDIQVWLQLWLVALPRSSIALGR